MDFAYPKSATEVLERTIVLLGDETKWTKEYMALSANREIVQPYEESAICFCLMGALERVTYGVLSDDEIRTKYAHPDAYPHEDSATKILNTLLKERTGSISIPRFNDDEGTDHPYLMRILNEALEISKK